MMPAARQRQSARTGERFDNAELLSVLRGVVFADDAEVVAADEGKVEVVILEEVGEDDSGVDDAVVVDEDEGEEEGDAEDEGDADGEGDDAEGSGDVVERVPTVIVDIVLVVVEELEGVKVAGMGMASVAAGTGRSKDPDIPVKRNQGENAT